MDSAHSCMNVPPRFGADSCGNRIQFSGDSSTNGMMLIAGGKFDMDVDNEQ